MATERARYRFGPLERRGLIAGWRGGQISAVALGLLVAVLALGGRPDAASVGIAVAAVGGSVAFSWWPLSGRTAEEWLPTVARWSTSRAAGRRRWRSGAPSTGQCAGPDGQPCRGAGPGLRTGRARPRPRPGPFAGLRILELNAARSGGGGGVTGVVHDVRTRTYTATMEVVGHSFALLGAEEKERRVASWASVLSSLARERSVVHRVQWLATTVADDGAAVEGHLAANGALPESSAARRSYAKLLDVAGTETCRHEVLVTVQVRMVGPAARAARAAGGGSAGACAVLDREIALLRRQLSGADVPVVRVLGPRDLAALIRRAGEPRPGHPVHSRTRNCPPSAVGWPWPLAMDEEWGCLRVDGTWHATYWIAEWPRVEVGPEFLGPLLLGSVRRSVAVVMEPLAPGRAVRQAERARTADLADAELRRRGGFLSTARRTREAELATRREGELADGHASLRFTGYVTVTAASRAQLISACEVTEQAASQCRLELRRLYGDQERAFTCTLPLARGLS